MLNQGSIKEQKQFLKEMEKEGNKYFGDDDHNPTQISKYKYKYK